MEAANRVIWFIGLYRFTGFMGFRVYRVYCSKPPKPQALNPEPEILA